MVKIVSRGDPIEPIYLNNLRVAAKGWGVVSGLAVSQKGAGADMSVDVAVGVAWVSGTEVTKSSITNVAITAAHASYVRYDLVVLNSSGIISVIDGVAAATSYANDYDLDTNNAILLAEVEVPATDTTIENAQITDKRITSLVNEVKDYAGVLEKYHISNDVLHSHDGAIGTQSTTYVKLRTITLNTLSPTPSTLRIAFCLRTTGTSFTAYGRIYKNGSPVGTEQTEDSAEPCDWYYEDISFAQGDTIEIWCKTANASWYCYIDNFRVLGRVDHTLAEAIVESDLGVADAFSATNS
ncbi:MAG: hypothetical protein KAS66_03020 [Candidatus Omnitrophica bacterium]|nr:hypothetical protein [Candidatus Omnitrophota bacterium]